MDGINVVVASDSGHVVVTVVGELDMATAPALGEEVGAAVLVDPPPQSVIIDLAAVTFCDSRGLRELLTLKQRADGAGVAWQIVGARDGVLRLFEITKVIEALNVQG
ncbi:MAG: anti-anti-sigma factor [Ilumatobacteraceae bacterium]|nr:anti-anti-sigma factor [Ilumatobacteraceae bacterium]